MSLFKIKGENVQLIPAKVTSVYYKDDKPENTFSITATILDGYSSNRLVSARPLFVNNKHIPLVGETVILLGTVSSYSTGVGLREDLYYLGVINLQGNVHHNSLPNINEISTESQASGNSNTYQTTNTGVTTKSEQAKVDSKFPENQTVKSLQPYVGDTLYEGRFGSSIRLTSTLKDTEGYTKTANWNAGNGSAGDPLMILRVSKPTQNTNKSNDFITEDFNKDDSFITLQSTQGLDFQAASNVTDSIKNQGLNTWDTGKKFSGKQIVINSGRIVFNSTQNEIIAFAKKGIGLSSAGPISLDASTNIEANASKIMLGKDADEPLILGNKMKQWVTDFVTAVGNLTAITAIGPSSPLNTSPTWAQVKSLEAQFTNNLSTLAYTKLSK